MATKYVGPDHVELQFVARLDQTSFLSILLYCQVEVWYNYLPCVNICHVLVDLFKGVLNYESITAGHLLFHASGLRLKVVLLLSPNKEAVLPIRPGYLTPLLVASVLKYPNLSKS